MPSEGGRRETGGGGGGDVGDVLQRSDCGEGAPLLVLQQQQQQQGWMRCRAELTTEARHAYDKRHNGLQTASY